jgi:hypothetical protein
MLCMECAELGERHEAIGICHSCSAGLCLDHAVVVPKPLEHLTPLCGSEELPLSARTVFCRICKAAFDQPHLPIRD